MISQLHLSSSIWLITVLMGAVREYHPLILHSGFKLFCVVVHLRLYINHFKVVFFNVLIHKTLDMKGCVQLPQKLQNVPHLLYPFIFNSIPVLPYLSFIDFKSLTVSQANLSYSQGQQVSHQGEDLFWERFLNDQ